MVICGGWSAGVFATPVLFAPWQKRSVWQNTSAGCLTLSLPLLLMCFALVIACTIGLARVFVGIHYPGDILGGAFDGRIAAGNVAQFRRWLHRPTEAVIGFARTLRLAWLWQKWFMLCILFCTKS